ncbi:MAG: hypothetical protein UT34_C0002G0112 [candidate division WS6 bacterium GW2011_GWF2_39_15]|uniref:Uncharacterized protein n=1 Tax=candidate division WS6 bacterium GW2011_GWF2_39_15 TaxID=1619100 RepID=A0A0G0Q5E0_9BACT|nr:MAG: hypothetical protein UT34_C0002G0112 [candidate division WS6 bacterium GW2011_GWF2_39_15]
MTDHLLHVNLESLSHDPEDLDRTISFIISHKDPESIKVNLASLFIDFIAICNSERELSDPEMIKDIKAAWKIFGSWYTSMPYPSPAMKTALSTLVETDERLSGNNWLKYSSNLLNPNKSESIVYSTEGQPPVNTGFIARMISYAESRLNN